MNLLLSIWLMTVTRSRAHFKAQPSPFGPPTVKLQEKNPQTFNTKKSYHGVKFLPHPWGDQHHGAMLQKVEKQVSQHYRDPQKEVASCPFQHPGRWGTKLDLPGSGYHSLVCVFLEVLIFHRCFIDWEILHKSPLKSFIRFSCLRSQHPQKYWKNYS